MISYYDLLGMIQEGIQPERIEVRLCGDRKVVYKADYDGDEFSHYRIDDYEDENYHTYLSECLLESSMFDKCIKILDEEDEFEDIGEMSFNYICDDKDKILANFDRHKYYINELIKNQKKIIERLKEN